MRRFAVLLPLAVAAIATWHYLDDLGRKRAVLETAARYTIDLRRPLETEMMRYSPSADFAAQILAASAIGDALGTVRLTNLPPNERQAWLDVALTLDDELGAAIDHQLSAIGRNPGWPLHRYYLGKLAYTRDRRSLGGDVDAARWLDPLESAWRGAPRYEPGVTTYAGVILEAWPLLDDARRASATGLLGEAFLAPGFVRLALDVAVDVAGRDAVLAALPDAPAPLAEAVRILGRKGDIAGAAMLHARWEEAEWRSREEDLEEMRTRIARGDWKGLLAATSAWGARHDVRAFDTDAAHRQVVAVLTLWPRDRIGAWRGDPRAAMVRYFLDGRMDEVDATVLDAAITPLSGVPAPVRARVALAAGNRVRAESIVRAAGTEGAFEWTDYFVDVARRAIAGDDLDGAIAAFERISPAARRECDVLVARRASGEEIDAPDIAVLDESGRILEANWSANGMLGICVDPSVLAGRTLVFDLAASSPALVEWGLNDARRETIVVESSARIELPLSGLTGRNVLYARAMWGGPVTTRDARVE